MRFTVDRKAFAKALSVVVKAIPARVVNPAAGRLLLDAVDGFVTVSGGGPEGSVGLVVPCVTESVGRATASKDAAKWAVSRRGETLVVSDAGGPVRVADSDGPKSAGYKDDQVLDPALLESPPDPDGETVTVPAGLVFRCVTPVLEAAADWIEKSQGYRQPSAVTVWADRKGGFSAGATDSKIVSLAGDCEPVLGCKIPETAAQLLAELAADGDGDVAVTFFEGGRGARFAGDGWLLRCPAVTGGVPPIRRVVADLKKLPDRLRFDAVELAAAVRSAAVAMDRKMAKMEFSSADGFMTVTGVGDTGRATDGVPCDTPFAAFFLDGEKARSMTAAVAGLVEPGGTVELLLNAAKPDAVGVCGGGVIYAIRARDWSVQ